MKTTYKKMWDEIIKNKKIVICTHINPDGDTIGSAYGLKHLINNHYPNIEIKISGEKAPKSLNEVNDLEEVSDMFFNDAQIIVVDTSSDHRISDKRVKTKDALNIDHHHNESEFKFRIGGDYWPATGQVIYEMAKELNLAINKECAKGLFYAIWTDTEGMTQRNINDVTKEAIKFLGKDGIKEECINSLILPSDGLALLEKIKQNVNSVKNITYVFMNIEVPEDYFRQIIAELANEAKTEIFMSILKNDNNQIRGSLRSKGNIDVSKYAKHFGGGGHFSSSGFSCKSIHEGTEKLNYLLKN